MKPKDISKQLRVPIEFVYQTIQKFRKELKLKSDTECKPVKRGRKRIRDEPMLLDEIQKYIEVRGIYDFTSLQIQQHLMKVKQGDPSLKQLIVPSDKTILKILKEHFHLKFGKMHTANLKYRDPTFNDKRLWVSRLLAQFMYEDALIITVDESNFRSDSLPNK